LPGSPPSLTRQLAAFAVSVAEPGLPGDVIHNAKRSLLDWVAAVLAGVRDPAAAKLHAVIAQVAPEPAAAVVGTGLRTSVPFAALANGYASHLQDFDDVYNPVQTTVHLGSCVWPAILALSELRPLAGPDAVASLVAGFETGARVGRAAGVGHYESSWQVTGTVGRLAAAAAAARALGLSAEQGTNALGIAAAQAAGIREIYGSDTKALQPGKAAMDGVLAGLLAQGGFTSRDTALEGERGLLGAISPSPDFGLLTEGLNEVWHLRENGHKLYPSASLSHPVVDAAVFVHGDPSFRLADVEEIEARMLPFAAQVTSQRHPQPGAQAKFSSPHCVSVALTTGGLGLDSFGAATVDDPGIRALREKVQVCPDESVGKRGAVLSARLRDGSVVRRAVEQNRGTPGNRLTDRDLEAKLIGVVAPRLGPEVAQQVIRACWGLTGLASVTEVPAAVSGTVREAAS
jgi:2-methylcitrate dehydratase PrpD